MNYPFPTSQQQIRAYPQVSTELVVIYATYYYRWSTPGQIKERKFIDNKVAYDEKKIISSEISKITESIGQYRGFCSKCNKELKVEYVGFGYADKGISGRKIEREEIEKLIEAAKERKFQAVFTPYSSRLGRRTSVSSTFRDTLKDVGVQIYSLGQPVPLRCPTCFDPLDDDSAVITESISDLQAQLELSQIRRNYRNGMPVRIKEGKPAGSLAYGLIKKIKVAGTDNRGSEQAEVYYEWDDRKTTVVKRIAKEFLDGIGVWKICQKLNEEGILSSQSKEWMRSAIYHILKNPIYAGWVRFGWKPVKNGKRIIQPKENWMLEPASFKGIWTNDYYLKIQEELKRRSIVRGRAFASDGLLIGILKCADCSYSMFQIKQKKIRSSGQIYYYRGYGCGKFMHQGTCRANGIKQEILDKLVINEVLKLANEKSRESFYKNLSNSKDTSYQEELIDKEKLLGKASTGLERANRAYLSGADSLEEYTKNKSELVLKIGTCQKEIRELKEKIKIPAKIRWNKAYEVALEKFGTFDTPQAKRQVRTILNKLIERVEFRKKPFYIKFYYKLS